MACLWLDGSWPGQLPAAVLCGADSAGHIQPGDQEDETEDEEAGPPVAPVWQPDRRPAFGSRMNSEEPTPQLD